MFKIKVIIMFLENQLIFLYSFVTNYISFSAFPFNFTYLLLNFNWFMLCFFFLQKANFFSIHFKMTTWMFFDFVSWRAVMILVKDKPFICFISVLKKHLAWLFWSLWMTFIWFLKTLSATVAFVKSCPMSIADVINYNAQPLLQY